MVSSMDTARIIGEKHIYLTTRGRRTGNPHKVELWFAISGDKIYLSHEGPYTDWMKNILKDSRVRFKIGGTLFRGKACIVKSGEAFEIGKHVLYLKYYGKASESVINDWFSESTIVEISMIEKE